MIHIKVVDHIRSRYLFFEVVVATQGPEYPMKSSPLDDFQLQFEIKAGEYTEHIMNICG